VSQRWGALQLIKEEKKIRDKVFYNRFDKMYKNIISNKLTEEIQNIKHEI